MAEPSQCSSAYGTNSSSICTSIAMKYEARSWSPKEEPRWLSQLCVLSFERQYYVTVCCLTVAQNPEARALRDLAHRAHTLSTTRRPHTASRLACLAQLGEPAKRTGCHGTQCNREHGQHTVHVSTGSMMETTGQHEGKCQGSTKESMGSPGTSGGPSPEARECPQTLSFRGGSPGKIFQATVRGQVSTAQ